MDRPRALGERLLFVTVGSTHFDELIDGVLKEETQKIMLEQGYTQMRIQYGKSGRLQPSFRSLPGLQIEAFQYSPNLDAEIGNADLVVSHAGAGSIIEALRAKKPLIVCANETLMDNHQVELAAKLDYEGYCISSKPSALADAFARIRKTKLKPFRQSESEVIDEIISQELLYI